MAAPAAVMTVHGAKALNAALTILPVKLQKRVMKKAVNAAARPAVKAAKALVPVDEGFLRQSLGVKVKSYDENGNTVAFIGARGPRRKKDRESGKWVFGERWVFTDIDGRRRIPAYYAHMVELGTVYQGAQPYLRPGFEGAKPEAMVKLGVKLAEGLEKEAMITAAATRGLG